jgi:hypothetical protein
MTLSRCPSCRALLDELRRVAAERNAAWMQLDEHAPTAPSVAEAPLPVTQGDDHEDDQADREDTEG